MWLQIDCLVQWPLMDDKPLNPTVLHLWNICNRLSAGDENVLKTTAAKNDNLLPWHSSSPSLTVVHYTHNIIVFQAYRSLACANRGWHPTMPTWVTSGFSGLSYIVLYLSSIMFLYLLFIHQPLCAVRWGATTAAAAAAGDDTGSALGVLHILGKTQDVTAIHFYWGNSLGKWLKTSRWSILHGRLKGLQREGQKQWAPLYAKLFTSTDKLFHLHVWIFNLLFPFFLLKDIQYRQLLLRLLRVEGGKFPCSPSARSWRDNLAVDWLFPSMHLCC